jgi:hypothetical protein
MSNFIYNLPNGLIFAEGDREVPNSESFRFLGEVISDKVIGTHYVDTSNNVLIAIPNKPGNHYVFNYTIKQWEDPRTSETEWPLVRSKRDQLLKASDWTQLPDVPLATKEAWATYRQYLRDVTLQADPFNIVWPTAP